MFVVLIFIEIEALIYFGTKLDLTGGTGLIVLFFKLGFTPCKAEQPLQGIKLQEKEIQKD